MSDIKIIGCCSKCDKEVFEIEERFGQDHPLAGQPRRIGAPTAEAVRTTFLLSGGEHIDLTFCESCKQALTKEHYGSLWQKVLRSWLAELGDKRPEWFTKMQTAAIVSEAETRGWREVIQNAN